MENKNREAKGFNKLFCNLCNRVTWHYKPLGNIEAHCCDHNVWPNKIMAQLVEHVTCNVCSKDVLKNTTENIANIVMCAECYQKERELQEDSAKSENVAARIEQVNSGFTKKASKREQFFVEEKTALNDLKGTISEQYQQVKARIDEWQEVLFEAGVKRESSYVKLQELARQLRADEREALGVKHIEYNPGELNLSNVKPIVKKERQSAEDKSISKMAQVLFGKKIALGNMVQTVIAKEHPEYFLNGLVREEFKRTIEAIHQEKGTMTDSMAEEHVKSTIRGAKAATITGIAEGKLHVDGTERK